MLSMPQPESRSFLFRLWVEEPGTQTERFGWRGHVTSLPDGKSVYVQSWIEVQAYIHSQLEGDLPPHEPAGPGLPAGDPHLLED